MYRLLLLLFIFQQSEANKLKLKGHITLDNSVSKVFQGFLDPYLRSIKHDKTEITLSEAIKKFLKYLNHNNTLRQSETHKHKHHSKDHKEKRKHKLKREGVVKQEPTQKPLLLNNVNLDLDFDWNKGWLSQLTKEVYVSKDSENVLKQYTEISGIQKHESIEGKDKSSEENHKSREKKHTPGEDKHNPKEGKHKSKHGKKESEEVNAGLNKRKEDTEEGKATIKEGKSYIKDGRDELEMIKKDLQMVKDALKLKNLESKEGKKEDLKVNQKDLKDKVDIKANYIEKEISKEINKDKKEMTVLEELAGKPEGVHLYGNHKEETIIPLNHIKA